MASAASRAWDANHSASHDPLASLMPTALVAQQHQSKGGNGRRRKPQDTRNSARCPAKPKPMLDYTAPNRPASDPLKRHCYEAAISRASALAQPQSRRSFTENQTLPCHH